ELVELQESKAAQKISVVDHINGFQYTPETPDNFVIDMEDFSTTTTTTTTGKSSSIKLQRSLSRKGFIRGGGGGDKKGSNSKEKYSVVAGSSPRVGGSMPEMGTKTTTTVAHSANSNGQGHHQITITSAASNIKATTTVDGRCAVRRNSFKRSQASWLLDPRKVLFFFATLSSIGTLLLICFTLSIVQSDDAAVLE
ncbi:hypothetical protein LINGRAPRIM_LOCUS539, partial [Linum grandiflorum]